MPASGHLSGAMLYRTQTQARGLAVAVLLACGPLGYTLPAQVIAGEPAWRAGTSLQRRIVGAAPDLMRIPLDAGQFIRLEVIQTGVDLSVSFRDPSAKSVTEVDSGNERYGPETVVAIAEVTGEYRLEVKRNDSREEPNEYTVIVVELRDAVPAGRETVAACRNYAEGEKLIGARTAEASQQAIGRFALAHDYFSQSGERYMDGLATFGLGIAFGQSGELRKAIPWCEKAAALFHAASDQIGRAHV